ncbi:hypothetical protein LTR05_005662 [Lithohypha guttulata]|uniref:Peptidase M14 domain-containing protein n=1 Tax=Lithohypha guttulata TaxID=1690604 RepID=A0AAN7YA68_9EURO|nr:hypothetical protein LTR05_005662 [Lithohypha guttulata]
MKFLSVASSIVALVSAAALSPREEKVSYDGFKVYRITTGENLASVQDKLVDIEMKPWNMDFSKHIDVAISPDQIEKFESLNLDTIVMHEDLGADIAAEWDSSTPSSPSKRAVPDVSWFNGYHSHNDHQTFLTNLQTALPQNSEIITSGTSVQGRPIRGIHVWGNNGKGKKAILIHGNVHAREWITSMSVEYFLYQLMTGYGRDSNATALLNTYDFWILPVVNPDGFVYSQTNDRLWRKNRSAAPAGSSCIGTDENRNWPFQWNVPGGSSTNPCDETYRGRTQGDTPEIKGLVSLVNQLRDSSGIKLYLDVHSYGQYILTPYGYSCSAVAANQAKHDTLAANTGRVIQAFSGTTWITGPSCSTLYATSGSSTDYVGDVGKAEYSMTFELRDKGTNGFVLPASQILPVGKEMWEGWKYLVANL